MTEVDKLIQEIDDLMEAEAEMSRFSIDADLASVEARLEHQLEIHEKMASDVTIADAPFF